MQQIQLTTEIHGGSTTSIYGLYRSARDYENKYVHHTDPTSRYIVLCNPYCFLFKTYKKLTSEQVTIPHTTSV